MNSLDIRPDDALVLIDIQNDFLHGGSLAVPDGMGIMPAVSELADCFDNIVLTQDWHPARHKSFASAHAGKAPFETTELSYGTQVLWPDHCVQGSYGAEFRLAPWIVEKAQLVIRKGFRAEIDSYSAFYENDKVTPTGLKGYLQERGIRRVILAGLATDYCVGYSAIDAIKAGFEVAVVLDACRGIADESVAERISEMKSFGVSVI